jgi:WD40 repeat protein
MMERVDRIALLGLIIMCNVSFAATVQHEAQKEIIQNNGFKKLPTLKWHKAIVWSMSVLKNGMLVSGSEDSFAAAWNTDETFARCLHENYSDVVSVCELADGRVACGSNDGIVNLWNAQTGACTTLYNLANEQAHANGVMQLSSGSIAFSTRKRSIKIWDIDKDICLKASNEDAHNAWICSLIEFKKTGYLVTASWDKTIKIWDASKDVLTCIKTLKGHTGCINRISELNDQTLVSAADDKTVKMWDVSSGECAATLCGHGDKIYALLVANDKIISGSRDKTVKIWDPNSKKCIMTIPCTDKVYSLAYSPNNQRLFVGLWCGDIEAFQLTLPTTS